MDRIRWLVAGERIIAGLQGGSNVWATQCRASFNLEAALALGLAVPLKMRAFADQMIESGC
jgi:hypothetical protein